jgi:dephospho-CoA kinase
VGLVICFAGGIGSGKSSVSLALAERSSWKRASFGEYLRSLSRVDGTTPTRQELQDLGKRMVEDSEERFCIDVLAHGGIIAGGNGFVDGVRHASVLMRLRALLAPSVVRLILLSVSAGDRHARVLSRAEGGEFAIADSHPVEAETRDALPRLADLTLDSATTFDSVVDQCASAIRQWVS